MSSPFLTVSFKASLTTVIFGFLTNVVLFALISSVQLDLAVTMFVRLPYFETVNVMLKLADFEVSNSS